MDLITTHINAGFDALGSLVAAKKLYPHSRLMLPGSQEKAVREFLQLAKELVIYETERECRLYDVTRLILVDTRNRSRIGIAAELVDKGVEAHIYDRHPRTKGDISADKDISENVGATVTILADLIRRRDIDMTPLEATIMLLGLYDETGSLAGKSTTKLDVEAATFLLSKGADQPAVAAYMNRELSEEALIAALRGEKARPAAAAKKVRDAPVKAAPAVIGGADEGERTSVKGRMARLLPANIMNLLKETGRLGNSRGWAVYAVGGLVRDTLLGIRNLDLDIVVEGDAIELGRVLTNRRSAALVAHRRFGTCSVITKERLKIDLAQARVETYEAPAALPVVRSSSLKDDLGRRDFTINAMAISLNRKDFGRLIDFFGGREDLAAKRIRVLRKVSFIDDPTRIFRAVRFEQRFGFAIAGPTEELIKNAIRIEMFDKVEPQRIRDEIILILKEAEPVKAVRRMAQLDELRFLHPKVKLDERMARLFGEVRDTCRWYESSDVRKRPIDTWLVYFMALASRLSYEDVSKICDRFVFRKGERLRILSYKKKAPAAIRLLGRRKAARPSAIYAALEPLSFEVILLIMAQLESKTAKSRVKDFLRKYNGVRVSIKGLDLKEMGLRPCPDYKNILDKVLAAKIDGKVKTRKDELSFAARLIAAAR